MGIWDSILKYGGKAAKATGRSMGHAALHPSQTLRGTGQAVKTAAIGGAGRDWGWGEGRGNPSPSSPFLPILSSCGFRR